MFLFSSRLHVVQRLYNRLYSVYSSESVLSPHNMQKTAFKFANMVPIKLQMQSHRKKAAVLIPLCVVNKKVSLLFTLRAPQLRNHSGQVSFPGGMMDEKDKSLEYTALRETHEELGIPMENLKLWGRGQCIVTRTEMAVVPIIGEIKNRLDLKYLKINQNEVQEVFAVSLEDLCDSSKTRYTQFRDGYSTPVFMGGPRRIWGLTAIITNMFLKSLLPSTAYMHRLGFVSPHLIYDKSLSVLGAKSQFVSNNEEFDEMLTEPYIKGTLDIISPIELTN